MNGEPIGTTLCPENCTCKNGVLVTCIPPFTTIIISTTVDGSTDLTTSPTTDDDHGWVALPVVLRVLIVSGIVVACMKRGQIVSIVRRIKNRGVFSEDQSEPSLPYILDDDPIYLQPFGVEL